MSDTDTYLFFNLLHAMLRVNHADADRARAVCAWAADKTDHIGSVCTPDERRILSCLWEHYKEHKEAPSYAILEELVRVMEKPDTSSIGGGLLLSLTDYVAYKTSVKVPLYDAIDAHHLLKEKIEDFNKTSSINIWQRAKQIAEGGVLPDKKYPKGLRGTEDAWTYVNAESQSARVSSTIQSTGGSMAEIGDEFLSSYNERERDMQAGKLFLKTGNPLIDKAHGGIPCKTFSLILGYAGQRKSSVARSIALNAAMQKLRTLFIVCGEQSYKEVLGHFGVMYGYDPCVFSGLEQLTISGYQQCVLPAWMAREIETVVIPQIKTELTLVIRSPNKITWPCVKRIIDQENSIAPLDVVVIDYIQNFDVTEAAQRDEKSAFTAIAYEIRQMSRNYDNGRGLTVISPAQGSRKGYEEAEKKEGAWDSEGVYMHSGLEKAADNIYFTFLTPDMGEKMKFGSCKHGNMAAIPAQWVGVELVTGYVGLDRLAEKRKTDAALNKSGTVAVDPNIRDPELEKFVI